MRIRIFGRHDSLLLAGLAFALLVIFQRSLQVALEVARDIEQQYGVALIPALLILSIMFIFHLQANRREMRTEAAAAAAEAAVARNRAQELEHLMLFSQSLARALSIEGLRETAWQHLPALGGSTDVWVLLRTEHGWERLTDGGFSRWADGEIERIADLVVAESRDRGVPADGILGCGHTCFPMHVGLKLAGMVGVASEGLPLEPRRKLGAAAALLGVAVRNVQLFAEVKEHSVKDTLTGCFNRAHALEMLEAELARSRRSNAPLSILLFDVDHFKRINDRLGHGCGDAVLAAVGQRIRHVLRRSDLRCRYGGDEFLILLPETGDAGALRVAEWIRAEIEGVALPGAERLRLTISVGVASVYDGETTPAVLIDSADRALYQAKAAGRNCVRAAGPSARSVQPAPAAPAPLFLAR
jgi:diguanylate cyclase (GGDEF)-like protein